MLKDMTLGQYFPGKFHSAPIGSAHEGAFNDSLYRHDLFGKVRLVLCAFGAFCRCSDFDQQDIASHYSQRLETDTDHIGIHGDY